MVRSMMAYANLPISFWEDELLMEVYILNHVPSKIVFANLNELQHGKSRLWITYIHGVQPHMCITQPINMENLALELTK